MLSDPKITMTCDGCGGQEELSLTTTARGYDERGLRGQVEALGWQWEGEELQYCESCWEEMNE